MFELATGFIIGFLVCAVFSHFHSESREEKIRKSPEDMRRSYRQLELEKTEYTKINFHRLGSELLQSATEAAKIIIQGQSWQKERQADAVIRIREVTSELRGVVEWLKSDWVKEDDDDHGEGKKYIFQDGKLIRSDDGNITIEK